MNRIARNLLSGHGVFSFGSTLALADMGSPAGLLDSPPAQRPNLDRAPLPR